MTQENTTAPTGSAPATVTVIEHEADVGLGFFAGWLADAGLRCEVHRPYRGDRIPERARDGLLVLGGSAAAWEDGKCGWLPATRALLARSVAEGVPTLGICLGAQLMTLACGGRVERGAAGPEIGLKEIDVLGEAAGDPLFSALAGRRVCAVQYHYDAMTELPQGAVRLATGTSYPNQAYRLGERAWAVQFHPEVTPGGFTRWMDDSPYGPGEREKLIAQVTEAEAALQAVWRPFAESFAAVVAGHRTGA